MKDLESQLIDDNGDVPSAMPIGDDVRQRISDTELVDKDELPQESVPYTVFDSTEKYVVLYLGAACAFWSSISTPIYYPALQVLESYFNISEELVNISVVVYLVTQGIAPTIFSAIADGYGRRPTTLICLGGFVGADIGLAVANKYWLILFLRVLQSAFVAPTVAIQAGQIGDYTQRFERGGFIGLGSGLTLMGQGVGSLIGAALIAGFDWRAIFWFLAIGGGVCLVLVFLILPETNRAVVGNQSVMPKSIINKCPLLFTKHFQKKWHLLEPYTSTLSEKRKPDFLSPFKIMLIPELAICLFCQAMHYVLWTVSLTTLTTQLSKEYHYSVMKIGLCYLGGGIGGLAGSLSAGKISDWNYRRAYKIFDRKKEEGIIPHDKRFNIVKTRIQVALPFLMIAEASGLAYGWCIGTKSHISSIIITSTAISYGCTCMVSVSTTLLVDLYPAASSAAISSVNFTRCVSAAVFIAALSSMNKSITVGGTITLVCGFCIVSTILLYIPLKYGMKWNDQRAEREKKKLLEKGEAELDKS